MGRARNPVDTCPVCGAGPFKVVAQHARQKHGLDGYQLRDLLGVSASTSITTDDHHRAAVRQALDTGFANLVTTGPRTNPTRWTDAGRAAFAEASRRNYERGLGRKTAEERSALTRKARAQRRRALDLDARDRSITRAVIEDGEPVGTVAKRFGISPTRVSGILAEAGYRRTYVRIPPE